jgi:hypothetical protein
MKIILFFYRLFLAIFLIQLTHRRRILWKYTSVIPILFLRTRAEFYRSSIPVSTFFCTGTIYECGRENPLHFASQIFTDLPVLMQKFSLEVKVYHKYSLAIIMWAKWKAVRVNLTIYKHNVINLENF